MFATATLVGIALATAAPALVPQLSSRTWDARFYLHGAPFARVLETYDDGTGPALYVGGIRRADDMPVNGIARWNGQDWAPLGPGLSTPDFGPFEIRAMTVFDGVSGPELYVGGVFTRAGSVVLNGIARWNGTRWAPVGSTGGPSVRVNALTVFDDGSGPALFAGGHFSSIGGTSTRGVAKWNGTSWAALGAGFSSFFGDPGVVEALAGFQGMLYAGGEFPYAEGERVNNIARWDGTKWRALGSGALRQFSSITHVRSFAVCEDARGEFLAIGGDFNRLGGKTAESVGRWSNEVFEPIGGGLPFGGVQTLIQFDDGRGKALHAGGVFHLPTGGPRVSNARWDGRSWALVGDDLVSEVGSIGQIDDFEVFDPGTGKTLFAAGSFNFSGQRVVAGIAELRNGEWFPPSGPGQGVEIDANSGDVTPTSAFAVWDDGSGEALYAGGGFEQAGEIAANLVAKWDGEQWSTLGQGIAGLFGDGVKALEVFDDGTGSALYAGGGFNGAGSVVTPSLARWDGVTWWPLGSGLGAPGLGFRPEVHALETFDDGSGPALYVGGAFSVAGGVSVHSIARWDGTAWSDVGGGVTEFQVGIVHALAVFDDGSGPALYAGGRFDAAGGIAAHGIARWDGTSWTPVGGGFDEFFSRVRAFATFDDGTGEALYAGGFFATAGGMTANNLARWDGTSWTAIGLTQAVLALAVHDDGTGPALYVGGEFTRTIPDNQILLRIGRWDGAAWTSLATGVDGARLPRVEALQSFVQDGVRALYVGGKFDIAGGRRSSNIGRWFDAGLRRRR